MVTRDRRDLDRQLAVLELIARAYERLTGKSKARIDGAFGFDLGKALAKLRSDDPK